MLLISLALLAQDIPVETDIAKAAPQCARVYTAASPGKDFHGFVQHLYLSMTAARAKGASDDFLTSSIKAMADAAGPSSGKAPSPAACDARFPLARSTKPATLPADPADRDILCMGTTSLLAGAARRMAVGGDSSLEVAVLPVLMRFTARFEAARKAKGIGPDKDAAAKAISDSLRGSLDLGNLESLYLSCKNVAD